ncbi:hypothetical protein [Leptolyngbya sp. GGD]|uniref:hypothetical protein n=1 Tax=Leptolyngbya sp. GGD TaxID=2997907 RepID=UPI00227A491A|nr:hypothetical protein [Leptolyngbya sp. GGD]MCY6494263.1 hypothetical protein [Leptolyngbya sp. GGD]
MKKQLLVLAVLGTVAIPQMHIDRAIAAEETYKIELREISQPADNDSFASSMGFKKDRGRSEWAIVTVTNGKTVKIRHATRIANMIGFSRWFDHKVTAIRTCNGESFDTNDTKKDCTITKGDTVTLPDGKTVNDVSFDFKYTEGGITYTRNVQVSSEMQPERK